MEEDIELKIAMLIDFIDAIGEEYEVVREKQALENLIKGYRELEEQLKIDKSYGLEKAELQKEAGCKMLKCKIVDKNIQLNLEIINLKKNYILKSKVKEKIEELETKKKRCYEQQKVIDLMAEQLVEAHGWFYSEFDNYNKEDFKEYFINKVEKEN